MIARLYSAEDLEISGEVIEVWLVIPGDSEVDLDRELPGEYILDGTLKDFFMFLFGIEVDIAPVDMCFLDKHGNLYTYELREGEEVLLTVAADKSLSLGGDLSEGVTFNE